MRQNILICGSCGSGKTTKARHEAMLLSKNVPVSVSWLQIYSNRFGLSVLEHKPEVLIVEEIPQDVLIDTEKYLFLRKLTDNDTIEIDTKMVPVPHLIFNMTVNHTVSFLDVPFMTQVINL